MEKLKFYDVKKRKSFHSNKYSFITRRNPKTKRTTYLATCQSPYGNKSYRIVSKDLYMKYK